MEKVGDMAIIINDEARKTIGDEKRKEIEERVLSFIKRWHVKSKKLRSCYSLKQDITGGLGVYFYSADSAYFFERAGFKVETDKSGWHMVHARPLRMVGFDRICREDGDEIENNFIHQQHAQSEKS